MLVVGACARVCACVCVHVCVQACVCVCMYCACAYSHALSGVGNSDRGLPAYWANSIQVVLALGRELPSSLNKNISGTRFWAPVGVTLLRAWAWKYLVWRLGGQAVVPPEMKIRACLSPSGVAEEPFSTMLSSSLRAAASAWALLPDGSAACNVKNSPRLATYTAALGPAFQVRN